MKKLLLSAYFTLFTIILSAQITTGDMAFIAFNADADDDFAMVTFVDIPANTTIYFTDSEWNGTAFGTDENDFSWDSGDAIIPAGTVITFNTISATASVSFGSITGTPGGVSGSGEAIFAFLGTAPRTPTTFIAAVANSSSAYGDLTGTGLTEGSTAITYNSGTDIAAYKGVRTGLSTSSYLTALNDLSNYDLQDGSGDQSNDGTAPDLPFDTTSFVVASDITLPEVNFKNSVYSISESETSINVVIETSSVSTVDVMVDIKLVTDLLTATETSDFTFTNQTITIPANSSDPIEINIPIVNDTDAEADELFILEISNPVNATLGNTTITGVSILDNDVVLPTDTNTLGVSYQTSYLVDADGSAEISAFASDVKRLYVLNSVGKKVNILDFSDITSISTISTIDLSAYGSEGPTSIAVNGDFVVAAVSNGADSNGVIVFMDKDGSNQTSITVGNLPDNVSFTPDGTKVVVANEGQPNSDYSIDPEGSISVINVTAGFGNVTQSDVVNINFNAFDADITTMKAAGIRIFGPGSSVSQDLEPEYIAFSDDSKTAWVSLQENNAIATINLTTNTVTNIFPLGLKDHSLSGNTLDASDEIDFIFHANWPIKGMYMPDAIASYTINGTTYLVTANEGDAREYDTFEEEIKISKSAYKLDPTVFPNAEYLKLESNLGELTVTNQDGDLDGDGDFDEIHVFGARSFSIWNTTTETIVYDSGDDFERITAADPTYASLFNASNSNNNFKNRSDNKGPEPEGVTVAEIDGKFYAFVTLERVGGFMTYDITDPENPVFEKYINNRTLGDDEGGDLGPEGIIYISPTDSPNGKGLIVLSNEVSSTVSVYSLDNVLSTDNFSLTDDEITMYPNPAKSNQIVYLSKKSDVVLFDIQGRKVLENKNTNSIKIPNLSTGTYILKINGHNSKKIIID